MLNKKNVTLQRRKFLKNGIATTTALATVGALGSATWFYHLDGPLYNECLLERLPTSLVKHPLMIKALSGIDLNQLWDSHFHLIGNGLNNGYDDKPSNIWLNPNMSSWLSPTQKLQYQFYLNAACISDQDYADKEFVNNIIKIANQLPNGVRFMLLAFDYQHDDRGQINQPASTFFVANQYAAKVAASHPAFEWVASVHPYRSDALEQLQWCKANGAKAVKWLPPAMNIDPSSSRCDDYYKNLVELNFPLITHAGDEKAVHSETLQKLANPLLLRRPLDRGVKVIVAHCASLGSNKDLDTKGSKSKSNFELFSRLMNDKNYKDNCLADISAINLINREVSDIKQIVENEDWHDRLLYASDYPLPGVLPIISSKKLARNGLLDSETVEFINEVRKYNSWLYDFLSKRLMRSNGVEFANVVFETKRHFV